jgi:hypothetical protein
MDKIKLVPPEGVTSFSCNGEQFDADDKGHITVPAGYAIQAYAFGFGNVPAEEAPTKAEKIAAAKEAVKAAKEAVAAAQGDEEKAAAQAALAAAEEELKAAKA